MNNSEKKGLILVVDDDTSVRNVIVRALQSEGYQVISAVNGKEALQITTRRAVDLVFLDITMPGMNGLDILTLMKAGRPNTPVVMLTGTPREIAEDAAMKLLASAYLTKPCGLEDIIGIANKLLAEGDNMSGAEQNVSADDKPFVENVGNALQLGHNLEEVPVKETKGSVIVVDDDSSLREVVSRGLTESGYYVSTAASGQEALEQMKKQHFDLMFLDIRMPGMSGLDLLSIIKSDYPATIVVMLTAVAGTAPQLEASLNEAFAYLTKPCSLEDITAMADQLLEKWEPIEK